MSTPVQRQFWELKKQQPDAILFFRLGDFYEMFFEDAQVGSRVLGITLTARHKGTENTMPMCGFPHHAAKEYLETLIENGYKVAIAEQVESNDKKMMRREIVRVVTPGTSIEDGNLAPDKNSFLAGIVRNKKEFALALADLSTGEFRAAEFPDEGMLLDEIYRLTPNEILLSSELFADEEFCKKLPRCLHTPRKTLKIETARQTLLEHFSIKDLSIFAIDHISSLIEGSALVLQYLQETQKTNLSHVRKIIRYDGSGTMFLDTQTLQHLEIFSPLRNDKNASTLWSVFDKSQTAMGGRTLRNWINRPLLDIESIYERSNAIEDILRVSSSTSFLEETLQNICDLPRALARIALGRGNARDLRWISQSLNTFPKLAQWCETTNQQLLKENGVILKGFESLNQELQQAIVDSPPLEITGGRMFRDGYNTELDILRDLKKNADRWLDSFLEKQKKESGIHTLKIKFSNNFGFCLEVSSTNKDKVPSHWIRRQTLVNAERFTTPELAEHEEKVLSAEAKAYELEHRLFLTLRERVLQSIDAIQIASDAIGIIDTLLTLAKTAQKTRWNKPSIVTDKHIIRIEGGRHPVIENISHQPFISNDLLMGNQSRFHLITGPNMAGKSTFLRQNALIILLAQIGSFVPADACELGIIDRIFTRVGASDNLAGGKSTFFVEMAETAAILNAATEKSFIILDEIGRGTSTFDGVSLAWAITEYLHNEVKAKTLFATHYHELIDCVENLSGGKNSHVTVAQNKQGIVFLRKIADGGISDSFGIEVAKLAGIPQSVLKRSHEILKKLEEEEINAPQPSLFSAPRVVEKVVEMQLTSEVEQMLDTIDPDSLSPREALEKVYELQKKLRKNC
jgi:DNA mismatch repair protein MutS